MVEKASGIGDRRLRSPEQFFGEELRRLRLKAGHSQDSLAEIAGYTRNYVGELERGRKSPSLKTLFNLAQSLRVPLWKIIRKIEDAVIRR